MIKNGVIGEKIFIRSYTGNIWSNKFGLISENGNHYAIKIDDMIFDNLNSQGVNYDEWVDDLGIVEQAAMFVVDSTPIN